MCLLFFSACNDEEEGIPDWPSGWKDGMTGKILFATDNVYSDDFLLWTGKQGTVSLWIDSDRLFGACWSPSGDRIAYTGIDGIHLVNGDGSHDSLIYPHYVDEEWHITYGLAWSPDGQLAFTKLSRHIWLLDLQTGADTAFMVMWIDYDDPRLDWSPDGRRISFGALKFGYYAAQHNIAAWDRDDHTQTDLTPTGSFTRSAVWSPDGTRLAFATRQACLMDLESGEFAEITDFDADYVHINVLAWSPAGDMLALGTKRGLFVIDLQGNVITVLKRGYNIHFVDWTS
jgi:Tol biopolymer transport system component